MTVPQIAHVMGQTRQGVQRLVNEMTNDGLLEFQVNPFHKRAKLITTTKNGREVYEKISQKQLPWANSLAQGTRVSDLKTASTVLKNLIEKLES